MGHSNEKDHSITFPTLYFEDRRRYYDSLRNNDLKQEKSASIQKKHATAACPRNYLTVKKDGIAIPESTLAAVTPFDFSYRKKGWYRTYFEWAEKGDVEMSILIEDFAPQWIKKINRKMRAMDRALNESNKKSYLECRAVTEERRARKEKAKLEKAVGDFAELQSRVQSMT